MVAIDNGTDGIAEIAQQMPAIGYLDRFRRALPDPVRVGTGAVACDDLDAGMLAQPISKGFGLPIRQQVHDLVTLEVDEDGAVATPTPPGPIIYAENLRRWRRRLRHDRFGCHAQQRVGAGRDGKSFRQPRSSLTAEGKCDVTL